MLGALPIPALYDQSLCDEQLLGRREQEGSKAPNLILVFLLSGRHHGLVRDVTSESETENRYGNRQNCLKPVHSTPH